MDGALSFLNRLFTRDRARLWLLSALPLLAVLVITGYMDPAEGYETGGMRFMYLPVSALVVAFSMALNVVKGYLVLRVGGVNCGLRDSVRMLARLHSGMILLEALGTLLLFLLRSTAAYPVLEQTQLFGHELIYAALLGSYLYMEGNVSVKRSLFLGIACFLLSSGWLLLSVIAALG